MEQANGESQRVLITLPFVSDGYSDFVFGRIIDGVGPTSGLLGIGGIQLTAGYGPFFRNFSSLDFDYTEREGCIVTSTQDIDQATIQVFPNPTNGILNIQSDQGDILRVKLYSSLGQIMVDKSVRNSDVEILVNGFSAGVYWLNVELSSGVMVREKVLVLD